MVELRNVSKSLGSFTALQEVSLDIAEGEFMTFLGLRVAERRPASGLSAALIPPQPERS